MVRMRAASFPLYLRVKMSPMKNQYHRENQYYNTRGSDCTIHIGYCLMLPRSFYIVHVTSSHHSYTYYCFIISSLIGDSIYGIMSSRTSSVEFVLINW